MASFELLLTLISGLLFTVYLHEVESRPLITSQEVNQANSNNVLLFLRKFGYLKNLNGSDSVTSESLYSEDTIKEAVRNMQRFGGLPQTGEVDMKTAQLLQRPRCGVPDVLVSADKSRFALASKGWNKRRLSYMITNFTSKMKASAIINDFRKALDLWSDYANLKFVNGNGTQLADIEVSFDRMQHGDRFPFDGPGGVLAHAFFPHTSNHLSGDIHFDEDENWSSGKSENHKTSFFSVAVHELGHSLGLAHSSVQDSVMFPYYRVIQGDLRLAHDDILALYELYIRQGPPNDNDDDNEEHDRYPERSTIRTMTTTESTVVTSRTSTTHEHGPKSTTPNWQLDAPYLCSGLNGYDTIVFLRNELFVFKGQYMWRLRNPGVIPPEYPVKMERLFPDLALVPRIDAAYEREYDGRLILFSGSNFWTFDGTTPTAESPQPLTEIGLPSTIDKLDGAVLWEKNHATYLFRKHLYWKLNDATGKVEKGYPKDISSNWSGICAPLKSVMKWRNGTTYFFEGGKFRLFNDEKSQAAGFYHESTSRYWFGCDT